MRCNRHLKLVQLWPAVLCLVGCASPYYADQGALLGGLGGAGVGALVGDAVGHTGAGAVIGAGVGALTGGAVGSALDDIEARNRAQIEAQMQRPISAGAVTLQDVVDMTEAGVDDELIVMHIRSNGVAERPDSKDLIFLAQRGVSKRVVSALQSAHGPERVIIRERRAPTVIVEEHHYDPWWPHHHTYYRYGRRGPRVGMGFSYSRSWCD
jgi:hypothetical protein